LYFGIVVFFLAFALCGFIIAAIRLVRSATGDNNGLPIGIPIAMMVIGGLGAGVYLRIDRRERRRPARPSGRP
jgi:TRAP-type C4-dicarboxylate transport system permease small subunit